MDLLAIVNRVRREAGLAGSNLVALSAATGDSLRVIDWVGDAWADIQRHPRGPWKWMRAQCLGDLTASTMAYTIDGLLGVSAGTTRFARWHPETDDYKVTAYLASAPETEWNLIFVEYDAFRARFMTGTHEAAPPQFWSVSPTGQMLIGPKPDQAYKLRADYYKSLQTLAENTDTPEMPADFHMAIVWLALLNYGAYDAAGEVVTRAASNWADVENALIASQAEPIRITARPLA